METCHVMNWKVESFRSVAKYCYFSENQSLFNYALTESSALIKSSIFLESDGEIPIRDNNCKSNISMQKLWYYPSKFISGLTKETCRDLARYRLWFSGVCKYCRNSLSKASIFIQNLKLGSLVH